MPAIALLAVAGLWLLGQATVGRLPARLLSYRGAAPSDLASSSPDAAPRVPTDPGPEHGVLTIDEVAELALSVGLSSEQATTAVAIAMRESGGNTAAHNPIPPDDSYGLWQINRLAWPQFSPAQLATAGGNAAAMLVVSQHGTNWGPWQIGGNPLARTNVAAARAAVHRVGGM